MNLIAQGLVLHKYNPYKKEACCPFHKEKTPSFKWNDESNSWKCFGCGETLDIYRYLTEFRNMSFTEAVK
jgi:DNA primase